MGSTDAQKRASVKWDKENCEKITVKLTKSRDPSKERIKAAAAREGMSVNAWVIECIKDKL